MIAKISIVVPVYNTIKYIDRCVQSVLAQEYENYEMLLIDDGSDTETADACDSYAEKYDKVFTYHKSNGGQLSARLYGIEKASGDYLMFLDSDDALVPSALKKASDGIEKLGCDMLFFGLMKKRGDVTVYSSPIDNSSPYVLTDSHDIYAKVFLDSSYNSMCRKICRKELFEGLDFSDMLGLRVAEDLLQSLELYKKVKSVGFINDCLYVYYLNEGSVMRTVRYKSIEDDFAVYDKIADFIDDAQIFNADDYSGFYACCMGKIGRHGENIAACDMKKSDKLQLLNRLTEEPFYKRVAKTSPSINGTHQKILCRLLMHKRFNSLIFYTEIVSKIRKLIK